MGVFEDLASRRERRHWPRRWQDALAFTVGRRRGQRRRSLAEFGLSNGIDHVSAGGGAPLEQLEARGDSPGRAALREGMPARPGSRGAAGLGQLEDEPHPSRGHCGRPEAGVHPRRQRGRPSGGRVDPLPLHRAGGRCRRAPRPTDTPIALGAQDVFWEPRGAYTGEISPSMLAKLNVAYAIVGHSERQAGTSSRLTRCRQQEGGEGPGGGVTSRLRGGFGETLEEREAGATEGKCPQQLRRWTGQGLSAGDGRGAGGRLRAHLGRSGTAARRLGTTPRACAPCCGGRWRSSSGPRRRAPCASQYGGQCSRPISLGSWPNQTSTGRSLAAPAWTPTSLGELSTLSARRRRSGAWNSCDKAESSSTQMVLR